MASRLRVASFRLVLACLLSAVVAAPAAAASPNDDFSDAIPIRVGETVKGTTNGATVERAEARHFGRAGRSVWYRFRVERELMIQLSTCRSSFDTVLAVFGGRSLGSLRLLREDDNSCDSDRGGRLVFRARRGRTYAIAVVGFPGGRGTFRLKLASIPMPANDHFVDAVPLRLGSSRSGTTVRSTSELGEPRRCCGILHTVWYRLRVATAGQVRLDACSGSSSWIAVYTGGRVDRLIRIAYYGSCFLQFEARPGVTYRVVVDDRGRWGGFRVSARTATPPANDGFADATPITLGATVSATTRDATPEAGEPPNGGVFTVWFRLPIAEASAIELTLANNDPEPALAPCEWRTPEVRVYTGDELSQLEYITGTAGCFRATNTMRVPFNALPGVYRIWVAGSRGEGDFTLRAAVAAPP